MDDPEFSRFVEAADAIRTSGPLIDGPDRLPHIIDAGMADIQNYVFIDGNYLARAYDAAMQPFFPEADSRNLDLTKLKEAMSASKAFYYDAIDEDKLDAKQRRERLEVIGTLDGFHIREGSVSTRKKKKQQKQVDVRLAVECLTHAFNKNFWHVSLIAGDLDFKPLVDALINLGIHVHVCYEATSGNRLLYRAADVGQLMTIDDFWKWSTTEWQWTHALPQTHVNDSPGGEFLRKQGTWNGRPARLWENKTNGVHIVSVDEQGTSRKFRVLFDDAARLEQYFLLRFGGAFEWIPDLPVTT